MKQPYESDIYFYRTISSKSFFLSNLLTELYETINKESAEQEEQKEPASIMDSIFSCLRRTLEACPLIVQDYFKDHYGCVCYEIAMNIYNTAKTTLKIQSSESVTIRDCIRAYQKCYNDQNDISTLETSISQTKKELLSITEADPPAYLGSLPMQPHTFFSFWSQFLSQSNEKIKPLLDKADLIFMLGCYSKSIYPEKNAMKGIQPFKVHDMASVYLTKKGSDTVFQTEYNVYQFEELYRPIQFQKCISSYYNQEQVTKKDLNNTFSALLYTKLFDTPHISLTEYIFKKYTDTMKNFSLNTNDEQQLNIYLNFQILASYVLPGITLTIEEYLWDIYKGDLHKITKVLENYIKFHLSKSNPYTFYSLLKKSTDTFSKGTYPASKSSSVKNLTDSLKNTDTLYNLNCSLSYLYFNITASDFLYKCCHPAVYACSFDFCYQHNISYYKNWKLNPKILIPIDNPLILDN